MCCMSLDRSSLSSIASLNITALGIEIEPELAHEESGRLLTDQENLIYEINLFDSSTIFPLVYLSFSRSICNLSSQLVSWVVLFNTSCLSLKFRRPAHQWSRNKVILQSKDCKDFEWRWQDRMPSSKANDQSLNATEVFRKEFHGYQKVDFRLYFRLAPSGARTLFVDIPVLL